MYNFPVQYVIYAYMYIAVGLFIFNMIYMTSAKGRDIYKSRLAQRWTAYFAEQSKLYGENNFELSSNHQKKIISKLKKIKYLRAFSEAMEILESENPEVLKKWTELHRTTINQTAAYYKKRDSMERAFFAWISYRFSFTSNSNTELLKILFEFMPDSTIYCRENVLKAFYCSGDCGAVERGYEFLNTNNLKHSDKLLSDGLMTFAGDHDELMQLLWSHRFTWNSELISSVIQYITRVDHRHDFSPEFMDALVDTETDMEVRLSLTRYFARVKYEPVNDVLIHFAKEEENTLLAIVAATALANYPGQGTVEALKQAVCSTNWYVRTNAAASLVKLSKGMENRNEILACNDRYGRESIAYYLEKEQGGV